MENKNRLHAFKEITAVENPRFVCYINNERVVIAGAKGAYIVNPITDQVDKHLNSFNYNNPTKASNITVSKNKQRIISFYDNKILGYDTKDGKQEWRLFTNYVRSLACDAEGETVFVCNQGPGVQKYQYATDKSQNAITGLYDKHFYSIAMHPSKQDICISQYPRRLFLYTLNDSSLTLKKEIVVPDGNVLRYSPDGSYIAAYGTYRVNIIDPNVDSNEYPCIYHEKEDIREIAFHPNNLILATLIKKLTQPKRSMTVYYWDFKNQQLIDTIDLSAEEAYDFAFSDDGKYIIITVEGKCLMGYVPFKIRWHNQGPYCLFLLKNSLNQHHEAPDDIAYCLMNILWKRV